jgi:DNA-binding transcriptional regulator LsrR (DeoR family)
MMRGHARTSVQHICARQSYRPRGPPANRLDPVSDFEQLVQASRLYYELGETQHAIAERLGVTRPQVSRLLKRARAEGIVEIRIIDRTAVQSPAADALRRSYGLDAVHRAPTIAGPEELTRRMVGRLAAQVLRGVIRDGSIVGVGDGATVSAIADALDEAATPVAATIVPLAGGYWSPGPEREPFRRVADALGAQANGLMAPGLVDDATTKRALEAHAGVRAILDLWKRLDVAVFGIGGRGWGAASVGERVTHQLDAADAVGEILIAPYDLDGRFVCPELRDRVLAFDARALGRVPVSIGVGAGESKVRPILGALRAGVVHTLVTDVETAEAVLALDAETLSDSGAPR